ncbi:MAG: hypothetical protein FWD81_05415 [Methanomassiliicoccaceae archaeon]|nr:hypothetical protein [Methanomassiliicoccaceae archaeon]
MTADRDLDERMARMGLGEWYSSLSDRDRVKIERYAGPELSPYAFLLSAGTAAIADENHPFACLVLEACLPMSVTDMDTFTVTESLIDACIGAKRYDDAKQLCENNLSLYPKVSVEIKERNGGRVPEKLCCRNRYVDIVVGIESGYDEAFRLLDRFLDMELISAEEHALRVQSLKIRRLQRSFDGVYTYTYKK